MRDCFYSPRTLSKKQTDFRRHLLHLQNFGGSSLWASRTNDKRFPWGYKGTTNIGGDSREHSLPSCPGADWDVRGDWRFLSSVWRWASQTFTENEAWWIFLIVVSWRVLTRCAPFLSKIAGPLSWVTFGLGPRYPQCEETLAFGDALSPCSTHHLRKSRQVVHWITGGLRVFPVKLRRRGCLSFFLGGMGRLGLS